MNSSLLGRRSLSSSVLIVGLMFIGSGATSLAGVNPPVVDAGPPRTIAFPAKDMTLFGQATDPEGDDLSYTWSQVSGPTGAVFSAPWALATTVTFSHTGTYVFRLTVNDGGAVVMDEMTATVLAAASQTAFYVDPTYVGGGSDGSASKPWTTLASAAPNAQWAQINAALATNNVIVYFSSRTATTGIAEVEHSEVNIWRTDTSAHRLTLDGMSQFNSNDAAPSWVPNTGNVRFHIAITKGALSIGVQSSYPNYPMHFTTIRGFELSGASGRALIAGNSTVFEYNYVHDVTVVGATVQFQAAVRDYPTCTRLFGNLQDITFRGNLVERGEGESFYIAGTYTREGDGGCPAWGNTHRDILIENNTVGESGSNGGQHDGIDLKAGLINVTVRGNLITDRPTGTKGISALGVFYAAGTCCIGNYVIENNIFRNNAGGAIVLQKQNGAVVRNNLSHGGGWMSTSGDTNTGYWTSQKVKFYNNTLHGNAAGIVLYNVNSVDIRNNLIFGNGTAKALQGNSTATNVSEDHNVYDTETAQITGGAHSVLIASSAGLVVNLAAGDFHLAPGSVAIGAGVNLTQTGFAVDITGMARAGWDAGAYAAVGLRPPTNVRIVP